MPLPSAYRRDSSKDEPDYFPTAAPITEALMPYLGDVSNKTCLEPAAGGGHMVDVLEKYFKHVVAADLHDPEGRGWGGCDFLMEDPPALYDRFDWLITNPPFKLARQFMKRAPEFAHNYAFLGRLQLLESASRYQDVWSVNPPSIVAVFVSRINFAKNRLPTPDDGGSPVCYAWFIWHKRNHDAEIRWIV